MPLRPRNDFRERIEGRVSALSVAVLLTLAVLAWRLYSLQLLQGARYAEKAAENYTRVEEIPALRGRIFDRHGRVLIETRRTYGLGVETYAPDRRPVPRSTIVERLHRLAAVLDASPEALVQAFDKNRRRADRLGRVAVLEDVPFDGRLVAVQEMRLELPGIRVLRGFRRHAAYQDLACHILGYINELSADELASPRYQERFAPGDVIGRAGVEQVYDEFLRGRKGYRALKVHHNEIAEQELERVDSRRGSDLVLTLDAELQLAAERILGTSPGAIVVLDATMGDVLALASYPRFNPNLAGTPGWRQVISGSGNPLFHRAISGAHAPGSVLKVALALGGLVDGKISPTSTYHCAGRFTGLGSSYQPKCWIGGRYGWGHGHMNVSEAIKQSCDVYFYNLALRLGGEGVRSWGTAFGLGGPTGIDLPGERGGALPPCRYPGDLVQAGIGQERWLTTPLQIAVMTAAIANGGTLLRPHVGDYIVQDDGTRIDLHPPLELEHHEWPASALRTVRHAMWRVVQEPRGTAYSKRIPGFEYAGKTGSAEAVKGKPTHAWFVAYAPYETPEVVISAFVEMAGHGGDIAAPMVRDLLLHMYHPEEVPPS